MLTPHVKPYYDAIARGDTTTPPPAEYHQPVPVLFLVVSGGTFAVDIVATRPGTAAGDLDKAATWCMDAVDDEGIGAKTAAGYGYLVVDEDDPGEGR